MSRLDRFKRLESPRTEREGGGPRNTEERFNRVEAERSPSEVPPPPPGPAAQRMERQMTDPPLALDSRDTAEQQFTRCMHCEADNSRFAQACIYCGSMLQTDEQREYNERFWKQRQAQAAEEKQAVEQLHANREQVERERVETREQAFRAMVKEAQHAGGGGGLDDSLGFRLIRKIESRNGQIGALLGFAGFGLLSIGCILSVAPGKTQLFWAGMIGLGLLGILFAPPGFWTSRVRRTFWDNDDPW